MRAARIGALVFGESSVNEFSESGKARNVVFINLDEDLPGDNECNPVDLDASP